LTSGLHQEHQEHHQFVFDVIRPKIYRSLQLSTTPRNLRSYDLLHLGRARHISGAPTYRLSIGVCHGAIPNQTAGFCGEGNKRMQLLQGKQGVGELVYMGGLVPTIGLEVEPKQAVQS
jgi:hypothetical protein